MNLISYSIGWRYYSRPQEYLHHIMENLGTAVKGELPFNSFIIKWWRNRDIEGLWKMYQRRWYRVFLRLTDVLKGQWGGWSQIRTVWKFRTLIMSIHLSLNPWLRERARMPIIERQTGRWYGVFTHKSWKQEMRIQRAAYLYPLP